MFTWAHLAQQYGTACFDDVIPFWERHSVDWEQGGYFTCLNGSGEVFDTDKFVWLQARQVWAFAMLYNRHERNENWLAIAKNGADFLRRCGRDDHGDWYFALDRAGNPLTQPYSIFSDCFAAMAFAQYASASGDSEAADIALQSHSRVLARRENPKGRYTKAVPGTRPLRSLALPMILANLSLEMIDLLDDEVCDQYLAACVDAVMGYSLDAETGLVFEHVTPAGHHPDGFDGRLINPGHGIEAMWFLMDVAHRWKKQDLAEQCVDVVLRTLDFGWDQEHGGIFYFMDAQQKPPQQLEWDQKLWWVHLETLVALAKGYALTQRPECWAWYRKVHEYAWNRFPDPEHGEWWGYLNRQGDVLLDVKGGKWKGCFHVPRALYLLQKEFDALHQAGVRHP